MTGRVDWVIFDVGETLVDESRAWAQLARRQGVSPLTLAAALGATIERGERHHALWSRLGIPPPADEWFQLEPGDVYPDAIPCLERLTGAGLRLGVAGNQPEQIHRWVQAQRWPVQFATSSWEIGAAKPDPAFFDALLARTGAAADRVAYVGDRVDDDIVPARDAGMVAVHLIRGPWGVLQRDRPDAAHADARIHSLDELPAALGVAGTSDGGGTGGPAQ